MGNIMIVTKEKAKRMIDDAPGDFVIVSRIDTRTHKSEPNKRIEKNVGKKMIDISKSISYHNENIFGILSCMPIQGNGGNKDEDELMNFLHNIIFPQLE